MRSDRVDVICQLLAGAPSTASDELVAFAVLGALAELERNGRNHRTRDVFDRLKVSTVELPPPSGAPVEVGGGPLPPPTDFVVASEASTKLEVEGGSSDATTLTHEIPGFGTIEWPNLTTWQSEPSLVATEGWEKWRSKNVPVSADPPFVGDSPPAPDGVNDSQSSTVEGGATPAQQPLTCPECGKWCSSPSGLGQHRSKKHGVASELARRLAQTGEWRCGCGREFTMRRNLTCHQRTCKAEPVPLEPEEDEASTPEPVVIPGGLHRCNDCSYTTRRLNLLAGHVIDAHRRGWLYFSEKEAS